MKRYYYFATLTFLLLGMRLTQAQSISPEILQQSWAASWITVPGASPDGYGVYLFRKTLHLTARPHSFPVHVSADNRYKLFVNEALVSLGPARSDLEHWNFETVDLAPYLQTGPNVIAAQVWNEGAGKPEAQISYRTGFILQGASEQEALVNTDNGWKCIRDSSYAPLPYRPQTYYVSGAGEIRNMAAHNPRWRKVDLADGAWLPAQVLFPGAPKFQQGPYGTINGWMLVPSPIPPMELKDERLQKLVEVTGPVRIPEGFPQQPASFTVPAQSTVTLLLDQQHLTNAYLNLRFSGGKNATLNLRYAEALYTDFPSKGNRNETQGKQFLGRADSLIADGRPDQQFTTLTYRTFRYVQLRISTQEAALTLHDLYGTFTGYPFSFRATLDTDQPELQQMLEIGWRTARLCAHETYMDCPYYEQLQYIGDARIQALVSLYNSGDDRLVKNALNLMDYSRQPEGVTLSRHPSYTPQYIPTFSLWYIGMLHDYSRYGADTDFVRGKLGGVRQILDYFHGYQQADGSLKGVPQWMFTDWVDNQTGWQSGVGPMGADGTSAMLDLQLLWAYELAAELETQLGIPAYAEIYQTRIDPLKKTIRKKYWQVEKGLFADRAEKDVFSQHSNTLAILTGLVQGTAATELAKRMLANQGLAPASIYFKYYLHQACIEAGMGNAYLQWLDKWRENIALGLTTWAESSNLDQTRSDCHAWGSSPNIEFYRTLLGIDSDGLGFSRVKIEPHLGTITRIGGSIPHPAGELSVHYQKMADKWEIRIDLPEAVTGSLIWEGNSYPLKAGPNRLGL